MNLHLELLIHAYIDGELNEEENREVMELIQNNREYKKLHDEILWLRKKTGKFATLTNPSEHQVQKGTSQILLQIRPPRKQILPFRILARVAALLLVAVFLQQGYHYFSQTAEPLSSGVNTSSAKSTPSLPEKNTPPDWNSLGKEVFSKEIQLQEKDLAFDMSREIESRLNSQENQLKASTENIPALSSNKEETDQGPVAEATLSNFDLANQINSIISKEESDK